MRKTGSSRALAAGGIACAGAALAIVCAAPALAQKAGSYKQLSPGNQMIAKSLFKAQADADPAAPWTLDRISSAKAKASGWGQVFQKMRAEGLVSAKNLGQVVSRYHKPSAWGEVGRSYSGTVIITNGFNDNYLARQGAR